MIRFIACMSTAAALCLAVAVMASEAQSRSAVQCAPGHRPPPGCVQPRTRADSGPSNPASGRTRDQKTAKAKKPADPHAPALDATTLACNQEYDANKAAIDGGGQSKAKFIKDCKNGTETIPGGAVTAGAPPPAVEGPPPDKPLPPASLTSGRPIATSDSGSASGKQTKPKLK